MRARARTVFALTILALLVRGVPATAQHAGPARRHVEQGERFYRLSDYPAALRQFEAAHRLDARPELLFNIARCHEVMAHLELAIRYYRRYLRFRPEAQDRTIVELRVHNLRKRRAARAPVAPVDPVDPVAEPGRRGDEPAPRTRWALPAGLSLAGVGVALLVTGIVFGVMAERKADEYGAGVAAESTYTALSALERSGQRYQRVQLGTLIAGGLVAATGGGLLLWDWRDRRKARRLTVGPLLLAPPGVGLVAGGRF